MKIKFVLLSLLIGGSLAQASQYRGDCGSERDTLFSCFAESTGFGVAVCGLSKTEPTVLMTNKGQTLKAKFIKNRGDVLVYHTEGADLEVSTGEIGGYQGCVIATSKQVLRGNSDWYNVWYSEYNK